MSERLSARVNDEQSGLRLDQALVTLFPDYSRARLQQWVKQGLVSVDGAIAKRPRDKVLGGELVELEPLLEDQVECHPQPIPLDIRY